ncbi:uncharacterized protein JCM15063_003854 [Sporobolomyces koalae]|uniref:uncharacterized protein n=1 Tax=Sporobolomyces koalae TaxID=500713 RepID=UPI003181322F
MSSQEALIHCPCTAAFNPTRPPPADPPLALFQHHSLSSLLFCEECDAIRCDSCASNEVACYYCPNCLFEVPSASVRGEKNRCARNCFQCPQCVHTLAVVASDPDATLPPNSTAASVGVPPYLLACTFCGWDSKQVGISFEKPTGLALQLQKAEEGAPEMVEFDHVKDHLEPFVRRSLAQTSSQQPMASSSSAALFKDIPGFNTRYPSVFGLAARARGAGDQGTVKDELEKYSSIHPARSGGYKDGHRERDAKGKTVDRESQLADSIKRMTNLEEIASLDQRWNASWKQPLLSRDLKPLRTPLQSKRSKRCPACKHILIKPEQKSSSTRYKIKLVAANYIPSVTIFRRPPASIGSRLSAIAAGTASSLRRTTRTAAVRSSNDPAGMAEDEPLRPGRTYTFEISLTNPLYEPIQVRLGVARPGAGKVVEPGQTPPPPPFAVNLPTSSFPISAYAEDWEYEDDENAILRDDAGDDDDGADSGLTGSPKKKRRAAPGIVERRMNRTTIAMEVAVSRDVVGPLRANMLVTYVYNADEGSAPSSPSKSSHKGSQRENVKTFSFWTLLQLGTVQPRPLESRRSMAVSSASSN